MSDNELVPFVAVADAAESSSSSSGTLPRFTSSAASSDDNNGGVGCCLKRSLRRHQCMYALILTIIAGLCALLVWRLVMGSKYSTPDEADALYTFDSPFAEDSAPRPVTLQANSIKILVWNLKKGQLPGLETDLPQYGEDRDLLILSEGHLNDHGRRIFDSMSGVHWEMGVAFKYNRDGDTPTGTMIGSHVLPTWVAVKLSEDREPIINTPKCTTFAKFPIALASAADAPGAFAFTASLLVISIHGVNAVSSDAFDRHLTQSAVEIRAHVGPVIFAGDFNTNLAEKVTRMRALIVGELGMAEVEFKHDDRKKVFGQIIDYVFTRGLTVKDAEVLGHLVSSDHKAMRVELQLV